MLRNKPTHPPGPLLLEKREGGAEESGKSRHDKKLRATLCRNFVQRCATLHGYWLLAIG